MNKEHQARHTFKSDIDNINEYLNLDYGCKFNLSLGVGQMNKEHQARHIFKSDIVIINEYLNLLQTEVKILCKLTKLQYPTRYPGRGKKGMRPNTTFAIHYMIKGFSPSEAANSYIMEQLGSVIPDPKNQDAGDEL